ncbi:acyl-CoA dehydrogenase family protein [Pigmentiphaga soli]|uniref:Acyl-CoA dehydrogenase family protein n=1 Tax=Pigmentiphaga soli TaxID=1007095 RepID=A0ABP8GM67_9BURK
MHIEISDTQEMLRDSARDFFRGNPKLVSAESRAAAWKQFADLGWLGVAVPETLGGVGGSLLDAGVLAAEMGRGGAFSGFAETVAISYALAEHADELNDAGRALFADVIEGKVGLGFPMSLQAEDPLSHQAWGQAESKRLVFSSFAPKTLIASLVDGRFVLADGRDAQAREIATTARGDVRLLTTLTPGGLSPLADGVDGARLWRRARLIYQCLAGMQLAGAGRTLVDVAIDYSRVRAQFGKLIGSFQAVQHAIVDEFSAIDGAELALCRALSAIAEPGGDALAGPAAVAFAREAVWTALMKSYDVLGGVGFMEEHPISRFTRDILPVLASLGTAETCESAVAQTVRKGCWLS